MAAKGNLDTAQRQKATEGLRELACMIAAACRQRGLSYRKFIGALQKAKVSINRKMLAEMAVNDVPAFDKLVEMAR